MEECITLNDILETTGWHEFSISLQGQSMHYDKSVRQFAMCSKLFKTTTFIH